MSAIIRISRSAFDELGSQLDEACSDLQRLYVDINQILSVYLSYDLDEETKSKVVSAQDLTNEVYKLIKLLMVISEDNKKKVEELSQAESALFKNMNNLV